MNGLDVTNGLNNGLDVMNVLDLMNGFYLMNGLDGAKYHKKDKKFSSDENVIMVRKEKRDIYDVRHNQIYSSYLILA
jgi:hypothetical protein